jgi:ubiquinone/menaquinone biosynthesis C-methylase UbiE
MKKINLPERWKIAQDSEKEYWESYTKEALLKEELERHKKKAEILEKEWRSFISLNKNSRILQIGCGPEDVITHLKIGKKYAVDPLADFYKKKFELNYGNLVFLQARGEELPFKDKFFDVVILANVLDHVESPQKVLSEIKRVLKDKGIFQFENLFYQRKFIKIAKIWGGFKQTMTGKIFNIHHPYMFTLQNLKSIISKDFVPLKEEVAREIAFYDNIEELKQKKLREEKLTTKILAHFGLYGTINYMAFCKKK